MASEMTGDGYPTLEHKLEEVKDLARRIKVLAWSDGSHLHRLPPFLVIGVQ
jgi:hypothetical protein